LLELDPRLLESSLIPFDCDELVSTLLWLLPEEVLSEEPLELLEPEESLSSELVHEELSSW